MTKMRSMGARPVSAPRIPPPAPPPGNWNARAIEGMKIEFMRRYPESSRQVELPSRAPLLKGMGRSRTAPETGILRRVSAGGTAGEARHFTQRTELDSLPDVRHEVKVKAQVVEGGEHRCRELPRPRQVVEEGARGAAA